VPRTALATLAAALLTVLAPSTVQAGAKQEPQAMCHGHRATIVGTQGDDAIAGTRHRDVIQARGGDDVIHGRGGNDLICGSGGTDQAYGDSGSDTIHVGRRALAVGGTGNDRLWSLSRGLLMGGAGRDVLHGGTGKDFLVGDGGQDQMIDAAGDNEVYDIGGRSVIRLGSGSDLIDIVGYADVRTGSGNDLVFATGRILTGSGNDYVRYRICSACQASDVFSVGLGLGDDALTIGDGVDSPAVGSPVVSAIGFVLDGGPGDDNLEDWFALGADETTLVKLGTGGSVSGPWNATLNGFENYLADQGVTGPRVFDVTGSDDPNYINVFGPDSFISGFGGDDRLGSISTPGHIDGGAGADQCDSGPGQISCEVQ
jgi:Ca2+-binding RTX toxin-like protein